jgi:type VI secretion system protein ImpH
MASDGRRAADSVKAELLEAGYRFDFFQAVRLLRRASALSQSRNPTPVRSRPEGRPPSDPTPKQSPVRLRAAAGLAFAPSDLVEVREPAKAEGAAGLELTVAFFGLGGAMGPLPSPLAAWLHEQLRARKDGLRDFLDIFHHRLLLLLYRGRQLRRVGLAEGAPETEDVTRYLQALLGLGPPGMQERLEVKDRVLPRYAGLLSRRPVSAGALEAVLADFLGVGVRSRLPRGAWLTLDAQQWTRLGPTGRNQRLGHEAVLGTRVWDAQAGLLLELGPLSWRRYLDLLPGTRDNLLPEGEGLKGLRSLTRFALGPGPEVGLELKPRAEEIPELPLGTHGGPRLGWTSWLRARPGRQGLRSVALSARHLRTVS